MSEISATIRVGRWLSGFSICGYLLLAGVAIGGVHSFVKASRAPILAVNVTAGVAVLCSFIAWGLALYHWGNDQEAPSRRRWGLILIVGAFIGAWCYWFRPRKKFSSLQK